MNDFGDGRTHRNPLDMFQPRYFFFLAFVVQPTVKQHSVGTFEQFVTSHGRGALVGVLTVLRLRRHCTK